MACSVPPFSVLEQCSTGTSQVAEPLCSSIPSVLSQVPCSWPAVLPALHSTVAVSFLLQPPHCGVSFHRSGIRSYSALASDSPISFLVNVCCPCISPLLSVLPAFCCCLSVGSLVLIFMSLSSCLLHLIKCYFLPSPLPSSLM